MWTTLNKDITPGQLKPLEFVDEKYRIFYVYSVWIGQGKISAVDLVDRNTNTGFKISFENLLKRVTSKQLTQL